MLIPTTVFMIYDVDKKEYIQTNPRSTKPPVYLTRNSARQGIAFLKKQVAYRTIDGKQGQRVLINEHKMYEIHEFSLTFEDKEIIE